MRPGLWLVVGARPNFVKAAPVLRALRDPGDDRAAGRFGVTLVHTGQHYDPNLSGVFFRDLGLPPPDLHLEVGSGSHAVQTAEVMRRLEPALVEARPRAVVVFGDVNSTVAAALTAAKLGIPVAHVEAGLRSFDRSMPEEINRVVTDRLSEVLFTTEQSGNDNLAREGVADSAVELVGNTMVDSLLHGLDRARALAPALLERLGLGAGGGHAVLTLHRPSNVDREEVLAGLLGAVGEIARELPVVFPVHPRTRERLAARPALASLADTPGLALCEPLGYLEFLGLLDGARLALTDSGGIQEETTALGVPCLTLRENTERPVTLTHGSNLLVGTDPDKILAGARERLAGGRGRREPPPLWDGRAAERIVEALGRRFAA